MSNLINSNENNLNTRRTHFLIGTISLIVMLIPKKSSNILYYMLYDGQSSVNVEYVSF